MAYTEKKKAEMFGTVSEELSTAVIELQGFVVDAGDNDSEEVLFAKSTASQLTNLVGSFRVREKRSILQSDTSELEIKPDA